MRRTKEDQIIPRELIRRLSLAKSFAAHSRIADIGVSNGKSCPRCSTGLKDIVPTIVIPGAPNQIGVYCPKCDYEGTRDET